MTVSLCFLCSPLTSPPYPLSPTHENNVHQPGIEPGSHRWQRSILPLDHRRLWKIFGLDSYRLQIPLVLLFRLRCMTQPSQANPHRIFLAPFQPPVRNPQETPGKPKETLTVAAETRRQPPSNCPRTPFAPLQGFLSPCIARFVFFRANADAPTSAQYWTRQHFPGKPA